MQIAGVPPPEPFPAIVRCLRGGNTMRMLILVLAACLVLPIPFKADAKDKDAASAAGEVEFGIGLVCDTSDQAERFVSVLDRDLQAAMSTVNAEAGNPTACILSQMAFVRGERISRKRGSGGTFNVMKILVVAVATQGGMQPIQPQMYFTVEKIEEIEA